MEGSSTFYATGKNVKVLSRIQLKHQGDTIQCTDFKLEFDVSTEGFKVDVQGLYDDPQLSKVISEVFSDGGVLMYKHFKQDASKQLKTIVMKALNAELGKQSFKDIIGGMVIPLPFKPGQ